MERTDAALRRATILIAPSPATLSNNTQHPLLPEAVVQCIAWVCCDPVVHIMMGMRHAFKLAMHQLWERGFSPPAQGRAAGSRRRRRGPAPHPPPSCRAACTSPALYKWGAKPFTSTRRWHLTSCTVMGSHVPCPPLSDPAACMPIITPGQELVDGSNLPSSVCQVITADACQSQGALES